jgi:hypothetical protein
MTKNLETADVIAKLVLSSSTVILFFAGVIAGPFAHFLVIVSALILVIFLIKLVSAQLKLKRD